MAETIQRQKRSTFAFDVQAPVQGDGGGNAGASYRGGSVIGGRITGGDVSPAAQNGGNPGIVAGNFFDNLLKPFAERKARENFIKGMTDQMYAEAGHEIRTGNSPLAQIFGPSAYEEGAVFYEARARTATAQAEWSAREDELKKLPPNEAAKAWADVLDKTLTGDNFVDDVITKSLLEASGPMLQSVAKARYQWQQQTVVANQQVAWDSAAKAFQEQSASFAATTAPTEEQSAGYENALSNFLQGMQMPTGQEDDSYQKSLTNAYRRMIQSGYGHAATALERAGVLDVLKPEDRVRVEDAYHRYGTKSVNQAAGLYADKIDTLQGEIEFGQLTTAEITARYKEINELIKRQTGFDIDYFDTEDTEAASRGVWDARRRAYEKQEDRAWQIEREDAREDRQDQREIAKAQAEVAAAEGAWQSQNPGAAMVAGAVKPDAMQARAYVAYQDNDFAGLDRAFKTGITANAVKEAIQSTVNSSIFAGYTPEFEGIHTKYRGMKAADPALAKEYFGTHWPAMLHYDKLLSGGATPNVAFSMAFGDDIQYSPNGDQVSKANKAVTDWASEKSNPGFISRVFGGEAKLNKSGAQELANLIGREFATDSKYAGADLSDEALMQTAYKRAMQNGQFEKYGPLGWSNKPGTTPLPRVMNMQPQEAAQVITALIDVRLKRAGFAEGASADELNIMRGRNQGQGVVIVTPVGEDGLDFSKTVVIPEATFVAAGQDYRKRVTAGYKPAPGQSRYQRQRVANIDAQIRELERGLARTNIERPLDQLPAGLRQGQARARAEAQRQIDTLKAERNRVSRMGN